MQAPLKRQDGRGDAKRNHVCERVEFDAELARAAGHARDTSVQHVDDDRESDQWRGLLELAAHGVDDARVAAEHIREREHARQ